MITSFTTHAFRDSDSCHSCNLLKPRADGTCRGSLMTSGQLTRAEDQVEDEQSFFRRARYLQGSVIIWSGRHLPWLSPKKRPPEVRRFAKLRHARELHEFRAQLNLSNQTFRASGLELQDWTAGSITYLDISPVFSLSLSLSIYLEI